jgi:aspartate-semialdehyde dehydrogenase
MALKPLQERFGIESVFVTTMQAVSGAGYPGVASLDILGNVVPYIKNEEEKLEEETGKLLGRLTGSRIEHLPARISASCNRVAVEDGHTESVSVKLSSKATREQVLAGICAAGGPESAECAGTSSRTGDGRRPTAAAAGQDARSGHGSDRRTAASVQPAGLEVYRAFA